MNEIKQGRWNITHNFKIAMVILLFALTVMKLSQIIYFPESEIVSDRVLLFTMLFIVAYLWIQELGDYHRLMSLNLELRQSSDQLKAAEVDTIASLVNAVEAKDPYTCGHSERVTRIALSIADEMKLSKESKSIIERVGVLHDIGKIGISDAILCKKEKLSEEEWKIIRDHPERGARILEPLKFLSAVRDVIAKHHEHYDGTGYPRGLAGEKIPVEALVLAAADSFDAMNSRRAYREPMSKEAIVEELKESRDVQYSAAVVDALLRVLDKKPRLWQR